MIGPLDTEVLRWTGVLGHTFVTVIDDTRNGTKVGRRCASESCDRMGAISSAMGEYSEKNATVYRQIARGKWKRIYGETV